MLSRVSALVRTAIAAIAVIVVPGALAAQTIRGTVVDRAAVPVPGVVVLLVDAANNVAARDLTNESGEFRVVAPGTGAYRIRTMRIGFRPTMSPIIALGPGQDVTQQINVAGVPFSLDTVRVVGRNQCRVHSDSAAATFALWEQARTALTAASLTARSRAMSSTIVSYERVMDPDMRRVRQQFANMQSGMTHRAWRARSADSLRRFGYVVTGQDGWTTYYAPDLDVLLSDQFLEDHCFRLATSRNPAIIGIAFEPTRERSRLPEIKGTLWLDKASAELRSLEFRYANVSYAQEEARAGGEMEFVRLPSGAWVISRWNIRMPTLGSRTLSAMPGAPSEPQIYITGIRVAGGELAFVLRGRDTLWAHPPLAVTGSVSDSSSGAAIAAARVTLRGTRSSATTDAKGRFAIANVLPGEYTLEVRTPALDSLGALHASPVTLADAPVDVKLRVPSAPQIIATSCGAGLARDKGVITGSVSLTGDSVPPRNVTVVVEWLDISLRDVGGARLERIAQHARGRTDARGTFRVCGVPVNTGAAIRAVIGEDDAPAMPVRIPLDQRFTYVEIVVEPKAPKAVVQAVRADSTGTDTARAPVALDSVVVSATRPLTKEEERRRVGMGYLITRADLAKQENRRMSEILTQVPGARVMFGTGSAWLVRQRGVPTGRLPQPDRASKAKGAKPACYADVWLDGIKVYGGRVEEPLFDVNGIAPSDIETIEFYAGEAQIPAKYTRMGMICGVAVIQTRISK